MSVSVRLSPLGNPQQFFDLKGNILAGGKLSTYVAGTTTPQATYSDSGGNNLNSTTLILDNTGRPTVAIWLQSGVNYKFMLKDASDVVIATYDNVSGINDIQVGSTIPPGSVMLFQQTSAPSGWTRISTFDDAAIRVVGNAVPASGGSNGFSTRLVPQISVDNHALTIGEMPTHSHDLSFNGGSGSNASQVTPFQSTATIPLTLTLSTVGSGNGHNHTLTLGVKFVDIILCSKN